LGGEKHAKNVTNVYTVIQVKKNQAQERGRDKAREWCKCAAYMSKMWKRGWVWCCCKPNTLSNWISRESRKRKSNGFRFESVAFSLERLFSPKSRKANDNKY